MISPIAMPYGFSFALPTVPHFPKVLLYLLPGSMPNSARTNSSTGAREQARSLITFLEARQLLQGIFRTKNLDDILAALGDEKHSLKRSLGPLNVTLLGIG